METLKDIKEALDKIPDKILDLCHFGCGEGCEDTISLVCCEEEYAKIFEEYNGLTEIDNLIQNIKKAQVILDKQDEKAENLAERLEQEGITDSFKVD